MKGLALSVVWGLIITIFSVTFFLMLVSGTFKNAANWFYCDIYLKILNFFTGREAASIPDICKDLTNGQSKKIEIESSDNNIVSRKILASIIACWKEAELKGLYKNHPCYEIRLNGDVDDVTEGNVSEILKVEDHCESIDNSDYGCGSRNQIIWNVEGGIINTQKIILIEYDGDEDAVEVFG